jgi:hypothetical protein
MEALSFGYNESCEGSIREQTTRFEPDWIWICLFLSFRDCLGPDLTIAPPPVDGAR